MGTIYFCKYEKPSIISNKREKETLKGHISFSTYKRRFLITIVIHKWFSYNKLVWTIHGGWKRTFGLGFRNTPFFFLKFWNVLLEQQKYHYDKDLVVYWEYNVGKERILAQIHRSFTEHIFSVRNGHVTWCSKKIEINFLIIFLPTHIVIEMVEPL